MYHFTRRTKEEQNTHKNEMFKIINASVVIRRSCNQCRKNTNWDFVLFSFATQGSRVESHQRGKNFDWNRNSETGTDICITNMIKKHYVVLFISPWNASYYTWLNLVSWSTASLPTNASPTNKTRSGLSRLIRLESTLMSGSLSWQIQLDRDFT